MERSNEDNDHSVYVIVLNWNGGNRLLRCIRSLYALNHSAMDIVVVDNGSTDDALELAQTEFTDRFHFIENGTNLGFGAGNNPAINYALDRGADYIWLVNFDCVAESGALENLLEAMRATDSTGIVGSTILDIDDRDVVLAVGGGWVDKLFGFGGHAVSTNRKGWLTYITGASMLLSRECLQGVGLFDEQFLMYWEDADLCERARAQGYDISVAENSIMYHEESSSLSGQTIKKEMLMAASSTLFFRKHAPVPLLAVGLRGVRIAIRHLLNGRYSHFGPYIKAVTRPESVKLQ